MKIHIEHMELPETELVIRCRDLDEEVLHILSLLKSHSQKICVYKEEKELFFVSPGEILYADTVDEKTFLYAEQDIYRIPMTLSEFASRYEDVGFLRISKSACINLHRIQNLKSCAGGRIEATMQNQEKIMISRHYSPLLRQQLGL